MGHLSTEAQRAAEQRADGPTLASLFGLWQLSTHLDPDDLMRQVVPKLAQAVRADRISLMLLDKSAKELTVRAALGLGPEVIAAARVRVGQPIAGWVALSGRPLLLPDGPDCPAVVQRAMRRKEIASALSVPLKSRSRVIGVLNVARLNGHPFTRQDLSFAATLGKRVGASIETAQLYSGLEERRALSASVLENLPIGLLIVDETLRVVSANRSFLSAARRDVRHTIGHEIKDVLPGARRGGLEERVREAFRSGTPVEGGKLTHRADGLPTRDYLVRVLPLKTQHRVESVAIILEDITERERLARESQEAERQLSAELAPAIAHELRNPLANALAAAQLLIDQPVGERDRADGLQRIRASIQRAVEIIENLLRLATPSEMRTEKASINDLLTETHVLLDRGTTSQKVSLRMDLAPDLPLVQASPVLLRQVFTNLVLNACTAMGGGGQLTVATSVREGRTVEIRFTDTGGGILTEHLPMIFDPYFTTHAPQGTGLGLSISRKIIEQHRGTITVDSEVGRGTTVTIHLPVAPSIAVAP